jgi:D-alanine-D-alanine ligase-like ATP-grasp enzyme
LDRHEIPNAAFAVIYVSEGVADISGFDSESLPYPLFIKPVTEGSSKGIDGSNKVNELAELGPAFQELESKFPGQDILVESFLSGREFTVSILGTGVQSRVIGIREHLWQTDSSNGTKNGCHSDSSSDFASGLSKSSQAGEMIKLQ